jgi:structural maintenance of chromosome 3 (chondroitin sulfate proteoglycan 6)
MHIKQIIIKGFKTYREQVIIGPLSAKDNVVVGQNGHGKSNFFSAIMFVLSDKFSNIRSEEKQRLIHEGAEAQDMAIVEIILDNSDSRLPIEKSTVSIKRVLEDKKDEFYIDGKHVTKGDINNLLESAGFSKSNPYYVVQQGRVASLAGMNEAQCLDLLKEVAGTTVFDERKLESEKLMEDTKRKQDKIKENLERIQEKIDELRGESNELQEYTKLEKERRAIEYILYKNHVVNDQEQIDLIESQLADMNEKVNLMKSTSHTIQEEIDKFEVIIQSKSVLEKKIQGFVENLGNEMGKLQSEKIQIESKISVYKDKRAKTAKELEEFSNEIKSVRENLQRFQRDLNDLRPAQRNVFELEQKLLSDLALKNRRKNQLFAKQGSASRFKSIKERNLFLGGEIEKWERVKQENVFHINSIKNEIKVIQDKIEEINSKLPGFTTKLLEEKQINERHGSNYITFKQQRAENATNLAILRHEEEKIVSAIDETESKILNSTQRLRILLPGSLFLTLEKLKQECSHLDGFHGPLIDLITIPSKFQGCADIAGRLQVFSIIVDNIEVARKVLDINSSIAGDQINIFCLDWMNEKPSKVREYPSGSDSIVLVKQIKVKDEVKADLSQVLNQVFGKCLIVRNSEVARRYAKDYKLHCVTTDGLFIQAGAYIIRGGVNDPKRERINTYLECFSLKTDLNTVKSKLAYLLMQKDEILSKASQLERNMQESLISKEKSAVKLQELKTQEASLKNLRFDLHNQINELEKAQGDYEKRLKTVEENLTSSHLELSRNELNDLSITESQELETLMKELEDLEKNCIQITSRKNELAQRIQQLEQQVQVFLPDKERKLEEAIGDCALTLESKDQAELEEDNRHVNNLIESCEIDIQKYNEDLSECKISIRTSQDEAKNRKDNLNRINHEITEIMTDLDKTTQKLLSLAENKESYIKKMGSLGALPAEEHDRLKTEAPEALKARLESNSKKIKKYMHVNKRALEQYNKYMEKMETLKEKIADLDKSEQAIYDLISHLESVKDDAIVRTFRSVAQHFSEVFHEIVTQGKGRLKMVKGEGTGVDKYVGVSISVSFSRSEDAVYKMQQLSGGQKTAVAIALIIAIQRADPAPFYLFDELDAALDSQLRNAFANVISRSSERAQFIMTTFKPELCQNASKLFEVKFKNKASTIRQIDKNRALEVIQQINSGS